jgi:long-subunit fatty acid transport protein
VSDKPGQDISFNVSPTFSQFKGPINNENTQETSKTSTSFPLALIYGNTINDKVGFGIGGYFSGGAKAVYDGVSFAGYTGKADVKSDLAIAEIALGAAYKIDESLKVGASWRVMMASASLATVQRTQVAPGVVALGNAKLTDLKDTEYGGFKFGAQYKCGENTLVGLTYRTEVNFKTKGTLGRQVILPTAAGGGVTTLPDASAQLETTFPMAATLGVQHDYGSDWRALAEFVWTQYSRVKKLDIIAGGTSAGTIPQNWFDQDNIRLAGEYRGTPWPVRFGYVWTNQVTNSNEARATFSAPGMAHTLTVGTGHAFDIMEKPLQFDIAGEYSFVSGTGKGAAAGSGAPGDDIRAGSYKTSVYVAHLGVTYAF